MADQQAETYAPGSLYIAGFTQAQAPHLGILVATAPSEGVLFHIRVDRAASPAWQFQRRRQAVDKDMFLSSLLRVHASPLIDVDTLNASVQAAASACPPPDNDAFGECAPWVYLVVRKLQETGVLQLGDAESLAAEVDTFARGSKYYARRDRFPNVAVSKFCQ